MTGAVCLNCDWYTHNRDKAQLNVDTKKVKEVFSKLNQLCWEESDMNLLDFIKLNESLAELRHSYRIQAIRDNKSKAAS
jgi:hypothetical protein